MGKDGVMNVYFETGTTNGYMFLMTGHVEAVCLLEKQ